MKIDLNPDTLPILFLYTAFDGGKMRPMADEGIYVPTDMKEYGPAEDAHMVIDHMVTAYLMRAIKDHA